MHRRWLTADYGALDLHGMAAGKRISHPLLSITSLRASRGTCVLCLFCFDLMVKKEVKVRYGDHRLNSKEAYERRGCPEQHVLQN